MKTFKIFLAISIFLFSMNLSAQTQEGKNEIDLISATLMDYIEGTGNGEPDRLKKAFHPDFNLYTVKEDDSLWARSGAEYIGYFKEGEKSNRIGRIISMDYENNAATAKVEIIMPGRGVYIDYFLLLKYEGSWKIVHKSYTKKKTVE